MDERIIKYFNGELSDIERIALLNESETDTILRNDLLTFQNLEAVLSLSSEKTDALAGNKGYRNFMKVRQRKKIFWGIKTAIGYAAAVCFIVAAYFGDTHPVFSVIPTQSALS